MNDADNILFYRRRHDPVIDAGEIKDDANRPARPLARVLDPLDALAARGGLKTDSPAYIAGDRFRQDFALAALSRVRISDPSRGPSGGRRSGAVQASAGLTDSILAARTRLRAAINALGGQNAGPARVAWWVLGLGATLKHFAAADLPGLPKEQAHASMDPRQAAGLLLATLDVLAGHYRRVDRYGLSQAKQATRAADQTFGDSNL